MSGSELRKVRVLANLGSGLPWSFAALQKALSSAWDVSGNDLSYQFCNSMKDGAEKARRAISDGVSILLVAGGDGTINTIGRVLTGTDIALGVLPCGSGNGFARHFGIPLSPAKAAMALADSEVRGVDVGMANDEAFFVTCSMAWDAAIARGFHKSPVRGVLPYIFAGVNEFFQYRPQELWVTLDSKEEILFKNAMVFTIANLTQYGGGAKIAPQAKEDDGYLELIVALKQDIPAMVVNIHRLFDGSAQELPNVVMHRFSKMVVRRRRGTPVQMDGDLVEMPNEINVEVKQRALKILIPRRAQVLEAVKK